MNSSTYDENITVNPFFRKLVEEHTILLETAALEKWVICLPRQDTIHPNEGFPTDFLLSHILIPSDELPDYHFTNLAGKEFKLNNNVLTSFGPDVAATAACQTGIPDARWQILFEEVYYTKDHLKVRLWCLSSPLINSSVVASEIKSVTSPEDAFEFLQAEIKSAGLIKVVQNVCGEYCRKKVIRNDDTVENLKVEFRTLLEKCQRIVMSRSSLRAKFNKNRNLMDNLKLSLALIAASFTYETFFMAFIEISIEDGEKFNKAMRNRANLTLDDLKIPEKFHPQALAVSKQISSLISYKTPLGKIDCLKKILERINTTSCKLVVDDILPILVFAIVKCGYNHWIATSAYISGLLSFFTKEFENGYESFLLTTLDAAMYFILSYDSSNTEDVDVDDKKTEKDHKERGEKLLPPLAEFQTVVYSSKEDFLKLLFEKIEMNNEIGVLKLLNVSAKNEQEILNVILDKSFLFGSTKIEKLSTSLCHPLCNCSSCQNKVEENSPSINSTDKNGRSGLHRAASKGYARMVSILVSLGASVSATDENDWTPLHCAASTGHQNVLLLLLHSSANINAICKEKLTALQLAAGNGHTGCVKALLYYSDHMKIKTDINQEDAFGNTALHSASKWGFSDIVETLLEYGAHANKTNKFSMTAAQLAQNGRIKKLLNQHALSNDTRSAEYVELLPNLRKLRKEAIFNYIKSNDLQLLCDYLGVANTDSGQSASASSRTHETVVFVDSFRNECGMGPLQFAAYLNKPDIIRFLLLNGARADFQNEFGQTALHIASQQSNLEAIVALLQNSCVNFVDVPDNLGNTALHYAAKTGAFQMAQIMLQHYPDLSIKNNQGLRAADVARKLMILNVSTLLERAANS